MTNENQHDSARLWAMTLGALGVVFGDIGTSPIYAVRACFSGHYNIPITADNVLGILSLIVWALILIVSIKYIHIVLRANNNGEGGVLALLSLAVPPGKTSGGRKRWLVYVGLLGAALLFGDGIITPAISVLSAVEGLKVATSAFDDYIVLITILILAGLFYMQSIGTNKIGFVFGPIIAIYFLLLAAMGLPQILQTPEILYAFNPYYAVNLISNHGIEVFWLLGSVFLVVTGTEALYADMGHFGYRPIRRAWTYVTMPALLINYLGQGALILARPETASNPFFLLAPEWALYPIVILVTMATVIASQALISGVFSLTHQAITLGYCPRLRIIHTSSSHIGQIYIPAMNWTLAVFTIWMVLEFHTSSNLVGAYGIAVAMTMTITTSLVLFVAWRKWRWNPILLVTLGGLMLCTDAIFIGANLPKIPAGGYAPLIAAIGVFTLMTTWKRGRRILAIRLREMSERLDDFVKHGKPANAVTIPGTAIYMASDPDMLPPAFARNLKHNKVMHSRVIVLSIITSDVPRLRKSDRATVDAFPENIYRVRCKFGFMETPLITEIIAAVRLKGLDVDLADVTFVLGRETLIASRKVGGMAVWREHIFSLMSRNAARATQFFQIPPDQVIEIGSQIEL